MSFIKFCEHCDNYMILKIIEENETQSLQYYCNNCGNINKKVEEKCINYNNYDLQKGKSFLQKGNALLQKSKMLSL